MSVITNKGAGRSALPTPIGEMSSATDAPVSVRGARRADNDHQISAEA